MMAYLSPLPNSLEGLGIAGGQGGRFFRRQLSGRCVITTLAAAVWADAWSCQVPTAALHVAEKISIFQDTDLSCDTVGTYAVWAPMQRQWGWLPECSLQDLCIQRAVWWS